MNIIDAVIITVLIAGFLIGFARGAVKQAVTLVGFIFVIVVSYYFKDIVANFCFRTFPFIDFKFFGAVSVVNILFYELISFLFVASILIILVKIVIKISGIIEKILKFTIILGFVSRIIGGLLGILELYVIVFIGLFLFSQPFMKITGIEDSKLSNTILRKTPVLASSVKGYIVVIEDLYNTADDYTSKTFERDSIEKFLKYKILDVKSLKILKKREKLSFDGLDELISDYGG